jgi:hypothetical protein
MQRPDKSLNLDIKPGTHREYSNIAAGQELPIQMEGFARR